MKSPTNSRRPQTRRKEKRPSEIRLAALQVFTERGFGGASIDAIAQRAGVVAGSIYRYYENKEELFRAVVDSVEPTPSTKLDASAATELIHRVVSGASVLNDPDVLSIARLLLVESHNFPDLARGWHYKVFSPVLASVADWVRSAQSRGEIRQGDPIVQAFSILAPLIMAALFHDSFSADVVGLPDRANLAEEHLGIVMLGLQNGDRGGSLI